MSVQRSNQMGFWFSAPALVLRGMASLSSVLHSTAGYPATHSPQIGVSFSHNTARSLSTFPSQARGSCLLRRSVRTPRPGVGTLPRGKGRPREQSKRERRGRMM
ncbi:unnamed protein product [Lampetra fluviatilis]